MYQRIVYISILDVVKLSPNPGQKTRCPMLPSKRQEAAKQIEAMTLAKKAWFPSCCLIVCWCSKTRTPIAGHNFMKNVRMMSPPKEAVKV